MNFLAHLYLSGGSDELKLGNFIADWVKGRSFEHFPLQVQKGIEIHRFIDSFTDRHSLTKQGSARLKTHYGRYSGIVMDLFFDHFLAHNWQNYSRQARFYYVKQVYWLLVRNFRILPRRVQAFLPFLIASNRLESYATFAGLETALRLMGKHTSLPAKSTMAIEVLNQNYEQFHHEFHAFFLEITARVQLDFQTDMSCHLPV